MANLLNQNIRGTNNYKGILNLDSVIGTPLDTILRAVTDGMGNASPLQLSTTQVAVLSDLFVGASSATTAHIYMQSTTRNQFIVPNYTTTEWYRGASESMRIDTFGNLIIGSTSASARLHVVGAAASDVLRVETNDTIPRLLVDSSGDLTIKGTLVPYNGASFRVYTYVNNASPFWLDGQGSYAPSAGTNTGYAFRMNYSINPTGGTNTYTGIYLNATETSVTGTTHNLMDLQVSTASKFRIKNNGTIYSTLQIGNAGLASGEMYKDTAANILSNGDYVVGMKA